jgi:hypothetical protein
MFSFWFLSYSVKYINNTESHTYILCAVDSQFYTLCAITRSSCVVDIPAHYVLESGD